jgi:hypothetical protein
MINIRNAGDFPIVMQIKGTLTTTASNVQSYAFSQPIPFNATIKAIWGYEKTPGTSPAGTVGDCIDLLYGAAGSAPATLLSSGAMFQFASATVGGILQTGAVTATAGGYNTASITATVGNPTQVVKGGIFAISVKTVASTTAGADFVCVVMLNRQRQGARIAPIQVATYDGIADVL